MRLVEISRFAPLIRHVSGQIINPSAPEPKIREHMQQSKFSPETSPCGIACASIAEGIPENLFWSNEGIDGLLWDAKQSDLVPACRVEPSRPEDISLILKAAITNQCHFAAFSGGHSRIAQSSNAENGITIDLRKFNFVEVAHDRETVRVGGGLVWGDVYRVLEKQNLMVVGGRVADVGVGGLILGGGISFLSNRYGWAADSVTAFEVILPDTSIQKVTQQSDPELYWALRGGGNNFGIITAFHLKLFEMEPKIWRATRGHSFDKIPELLPAQHEFVTAIQPKDPDAVALFPYAYVKQYDMFMSFHSLFHLSHRDNATWPVAFKAFESIEPIPDTTEVVIKPVSECTEDMMAMSPRGMRTIYKTVTYRSSPEVDKKIIQIYQEAVEKVKHLDFIIPTIVFHPTPVGHTSPMQKNGGNPLGLAGEGPLTIMQTSWMWKNKEDDALNDKVNQEMFEKVIKFAKAEKAWVPYIYQNYAWEDQDVFAGYGKENLARLQAIQKKIDPDGVFAGGEGLSRGYFKVNVKGAVSDEETTDRDEL